jgi:uncharacterized protein YjbJ (UPF0337 family)
MNKDQFEGSWKQVKGRLKEFWGDLTDDEIDKMSGSYDRFVGTIQEKYGKSKEEARDSVNQFLKKIGNDGKVEIKKH